ncbi:MAG TPA: VOC family protein [Candidatus Methylomirabilis sp.]|nr:VOC family protein [Candidatus Methylomirabilis sp.]
MSSEQHGIPSAPPQAVAPRGINHLVLNVRNMERSHRFWTDVMGFRQVAELRPKPGRPPMKMRFYSGIDERGAVNHHDLALAEVSTEHEGGDSETWSLAARRVGLNHVAITYPDRESWLKQLAFLRSKGVPFHLRINHGMTHSVYISDPDGHGIEVLYELAPEVWEDIDAAQNYSERLPTEGDESLVDTTNNPVFSKRA